jgi:hypothetical protein
MRAALFLVLTAVLATACMRPDKVQQKPKPAAEDTAGKGSPELVAKPETPDKFIVLLSGSETGDAEGNPAEQGLVDLNAKDAEGKAIPPKANLTDKKTDISCEVLIMNDGKTINITMKKGNESSAVVINTGSGVLTFAKESCGVHPQPSAKPAAKTE